MNDAVINIIIIRHEWTKVQTSIFSVSPSSLSLSPIKCTRMIAASRPEVDPEEAKMVSIVLNVLTMFAQVSRQRL